MTLVVHGGFAKIPPSMSQKIEIQNQVNQLSERLGFRAFTFGADKKETALRALSRFVKSMAGRMERNEMPGDAQRNLVALDLVSNFIRQVISANDEQLVKLAERLKKDDETLLNDHVQSVLNYLKQHYPRQTTSNMVILIKSALANAKLAEGEEAKKLADEHLANVRKTETNLRKELDQLAQALAEGHGAVSQAAKGLQLKAEILKKYPWPFNHAAVEAAKQGLETAEQKLKERSEVRRQEAKKSVDKPQREYRDNGAQNNQLAQLLQAAIGKK